MPALTREQVRAAAIVEAFMTLTVKLSYADPATIAAAVEFIRTNDGEASADTLAALAKAAADV